MHIWGKPLCFIVAHEPCPLACYHWLPNTSRWRAGADEYMQDVESMLRKLGRAPYLRLRQPALVLRLIWFFCTTWANSARTALPAQYVLDHFSWIKIMNSDSSVYVFVSANGAFRGLSRLPHGVNLPQTDGIAWLPNDTIPLTLSALEKFVENSDVAMADLVMRGYHIVRHHDGYVRGGRTTLRERYRNLLRLIPQMRTCPGGSDRFTLCAKT
jgi:hypothetical protein